MWKLVTGEPYAGKSHVRFGGRGGAEPSLPLSAGVLRLLKGLLALLKIIDIGARKLDALGELRMLAPVSL